MQNNKTYSYFKIVVPTILTVAILIFTYKSVFSNTGFSETPMNYGIVVYLLGMISVGYAFHLVIIKKSIHSKPAYCLILSIIGTIAIVAGCWYVF